MTLFADTDHRAMLSALGETVVIVDGTTDGQSVTAIFDGDFSRAVMTGDGPAVESYAPRVTMLSSEATAIKHGTGVVAREKSYEVTGIQADGAGMTLLILQEVG